MALQSTHKKALSSPYQGGPDRFPVPEDKISWGVEFQDYKPVEFVHPVVAKQPVWADNPQKIREGEVKWNQLDGKVDRVSFTGEYQIDPNSKFPLNPVGRTGMTERGLLGRFGPNHAADPIVTRFRRFNNGEIQLDEQGKAILEFVAVQRKDNGQWAIPGGMVEPGDTVSATLKKEFGEEALNSIEASEEEKAQIQRQTEELFAKSEEIYKGYVDDPRNTDNAWMETVAVNIHDHNGKVFNKIDLKAGDDAKDVAWTAIEPGLELYASHRQFIDTVYDLRVTKRGHGLKPQQ